MKRDLALLAANEFDVLIVGGGIYGAAIAREAALSGLSTALVEKGDFCSATSANSLKIIHGGLRYLQQVDLIRVRESVRERRAMLRIAPHLIHPLACLMPTAGLLKSLPVMSCALIANAILSADRNRGVRADRHLAAGRVVLRKGLEELVPGYSGPGTGAAIWHDAVADDTERLVIEMLMAAAGAGAQVANYVTCTGFLGDEDRVDGIAARDELSGETMEIRSRVVINAAGPWCNRLLSLQSRVAPLPYALALGMNAVLKRTLIPSYAVGLECQEEGPDKGRLMFVVPWQGTTMAGTYYRLYKGAPGDLQPSEQDLAALLGQLNSAMPFVRLVPDDVGRIHAGLLPCDPQRSTERDPKLLRHYTLKDHSRSDGVDGLISVLGVKYTTARDVAARTIALAGRKLGRTLAPSRSADVPLPEGRGRLIDGSDLADVVTAAVEDEMAQTLSDVIYRRTGIGGAAVPADDILPSCAQVMKECCGWDRSRCEHEIRAACRPAFGFGGIGEPGK